MVTVYLILFLIFGLIIGSFLNVLILRMDNLKSVLTERSECPKCKKTIRWHDLIPVFSFILLRGRCRDCGEKISWQYPLVEIITGLLFGFIYYNFGLSADSLFYMTVFSLLTVVFVFDLKTQTIPDPFVWIVLILSLLFGWYFGNFSILSAIIGALIPGLFLGALVYFSKETWMGAGDIKVGMIIGALAGYPVVLFGLFFAFLLGSIFGLIYIFYKNRAITRDNLKESLPFAPFLIFSTFFSLIYGQRIVDWYLGKFYF